MVSFNNPLKFSVTKNTIKNTLDFQLTKIDGNLLVLNNKNIHNLSFRETGNKKTASNEQVN